MRNTLQGNTRHPKGLYGRIALACLLASMIIGTPARAQTFTVLHAFKGSPTDGSIPASGLTLDKAGNLYGTTYGAYNGFGDGSGTVFKLNKRGKETVLYTFTGGTDGGFPWAGVVRDAVGNLYGATSQGGDLSCSVGSLIGCGVVFKVDPTGKETVLYTFGGGADGATPWGDLLRDKAGNLYGTTQYGGDLNSCGAGVGCGTVFKLDPNGNETVLYTFSGADGAFPFTGLIQDKSGNFYGTASYGGAHGYGVIFKLDGSGKETVLHDFVGYGDGALPFSPLLRDAVGNLYGTTSRAVRQKNAGTIFKVHPGHRLTTLYRFTGGADGGGPSGRLVLDAAGNLYGTTSGGGRGGGTVFKLDTNNAETVLHSFNNRRGGRGGRFPFGGLASDTTGSLYATTSEGGTAGDGLAFKITP